MTLKEKAYQELRQLILAGKLQPGQFLTERSLVALLGMSRTPIRSALEKLEIEGFIKQSPNQGIIILDISISKVVEIYDLRMALETHLVRNLSSRGLNHQQLELLQKNLSEQKNYLEAKDEEHFTAKDSEFHTALAVVYGNTEITQIMENIQDKTYLLALRLMRKVDTRMLDSYHDHADILNKICQGEGEEAVIIVSQHLEYGKRTLIS